MGATPAPPAKKAKGGWMAIGFAILIALFVWAIAPKGTTEPKASGGGAVSTYNPNKICPLPATKAVGGEINNPLGIKFNSYVGKELDGTDSGITAQDGGTFARFATPEAGLAAGKKILTQASLYHGKSIDWSMGKWSNNGYHGEIAKAVGLDPETVVDELDGDQLDTLISAMQKREGTNPSATMVAYVNPNDHSKDHVEFFDVVLTEGCWTDWVRVPRYWNGWANDEFTGDEPNPQVSFWYFGWSQRGPFYPNGIPGFRYPPDAGDGRAKWRNRGKGILRYRQTG
jgi:hypothetical protein